MSISAADCLKMVNEVHARHNVTLLLTLPPGRHFERHMDAMRCPTAGCGKAMRIACTRPPGKSEFGAACACGERRFYDCAESLP